MNICDHLKGILSCIILLGCTAGLQAESLPETSLTPPPPRHGESPYRNAFSPNLKCKRRIF